MLVKSLSQTLSQGLTANLRTDKNQRGEWISNLLPPGDTMPVYEYECSEHGRFSAIQPMSGERKADCPACSMPGEPRISLFNSRSAEPLTVYQDLGGRGDRHRGYQEIGWSPDSGTHPAFGQPYKTAKEVVREEHQGIKEV